MLPRGYFPKTYYNRYFGNIGAIAILVCDYVKHVWFSIETKVTNLRKEMKRYG